MFTKLLSFTSQLGQISSTPPDLFTIKKQTSDQQEILLELFERGVPLSSSVIGITYKLSGEVPLGDIRTQLLNLERQQPNLTTTYRKKPSEDAQESGKRYDAYEQEPSDVGVISASSIEEFRELESKPIPIDDPRQYRVIHYYDEKSNKTYLRFLSNHMNLDQFGAGIVLFFSANASYWRQLGIDSIGETLGPLLGSALSNITRNFLPGGTFFGVDSQALVRRQLEVVEQISEDSTSLEEFFAPFAASEYDETSSLLDEPDQRQPVGAMHSKTFRVPAKTIKTLAKQLDLEGQEHVVFEALLCMAYHKQYGAMPALRVPDKGRDLGRGMWERTFHPSSDGATDYTAVGIPAFVNIDDSMTLKDVCAALKTQYKTYARNGFNALPLETAVALVNSETDLELNTFIAGFNFKPSSFAFDFGLRGESRLHRGASWAVNPHDYKDGYRIQEECNITYEKESDEYVVSFDGSCRFVDPTETETRRDIFQSLIEVFSDPDNVGKPASEVFEQVEAPAFPDGQGNSLESSESGSPVASSQSMSATADDSEEDVGGKTDEAPTVVEIDDFYQPGDANTPTQSTVSRTAVWTTRGSLLSAAAFGAFLLYRFIGGDQAEPPELPS